MISNNKENQAFLYSIVPISILEDKDLTALEKLLLIHIISLCKNKSYCWATNRYFHKIYHVSIQTISKSINKLAKNGYILSNYEKHMINTSKRRIVLTNAFEVQITSIKREMNTSFQKNISTSIKNKLNQ